MAGWTVQLQQGFLRALCPFGTSRLVILTETHGPGSSIRDRSGGSEVPTLFPSVELCGRPDPDRRRFPSRNLDFRDCPYRGDLASQNRNNGNPIQAAQGNNLTSGTAGSRALSSAQIGPRCQPLFARPSPGPLLSSPGIQWLWTFLPAPLPIHPDEQRSLRKIDSRLRESCFDWSVQAGVFVRFWMLGSGRRLVFCVSLYCFHEIKHNAGLPYRHPWSIAQ